MSPGQRIAVLTRRLSLEAQARAILATCSAGEMWSADSYVPRVNLFTKTDQFDHSDWVKGALTVTANAYTSPSGVNTADKVIPSTGNSVHYIFQSPVVPASRFTTTTVRALAAGYSWLGIEWYTGTAFQYARINVATGVLGIVNGSLTVTTPVLIDGMYEFSVTVQTAATGAPKIAFYPATADGSGASGLTYAGDGVSGVYLNQAQQVLGSVVLPYQRVNTPTDYDTTVSVTPVLQDPVALLPSIGPFANPVTQATAGNRPLFSRRVNFLTKTADFNSTVWGVSDTGGSLVANSASAPDGTNTAAVWTWPSTTSSFAYLAQIYTTPFANLPWRYTLWIRKQSGSRGGVLLGLSNAVTTVYSAANNITTSWQKISIQLTAGQLAAASILRVGIINGVAGDVFEIWRPALTLDAAEPPYQWVNIANDYDAVGFPAYLDFDGVNDSLATAAAIGLNGPGIYTAVAAMPTRAAGTNEIILSNSRYAFSRRNPSNSCGFTVQSSADYPSASAAWAQNTAAVVGSTFYAALGVTHRINGVEGSTVTATTDSGFAEGSMFMGCNLGSALYFQGRFYAAFTGKRATAFTSAEKITIDRWLASKNGVTI